MVEIPCLVDSPFETVTLRLFFDYHALTETTGEDFLVDSRWSEGIELIARRAHGEFTSMVASLRNEISEDGLTVELTLQTRRNFSLRPTPTAEWNEVAAALAELTEVPGQIAFDAEYSVSRAELPPQGIIASMLGVKTSVAGEQLLLTGANFMIRGFPMDSVSWYVLDGDVIRGTVARRTTEKFHKNWLADALYVAQSRFQRLILEQPTRSSHEVASAK